ncbi:MAG: hypothetical protein ACTSYD_00460 [Candidatus Heimdallarchaeaceae archaeon]
MGFSLLLSIHLIIGSFSSLFIIFVSILLFRSYSRIKIQSTGVFALGTIFLAVWAIMSTFYPIASTKNIADIMYIIGVIASYLGMFSIFLFLELIRSESINPIRLFVLSAFFGAICFLLINKIPEPIGFSMPLKKDFGYYAAAQLPFLVVQVGFILTVAVEFTITTIEMIKKSDIHKRRTQSIILLIGSSVAFYGAMVALVVVELIFVPSLVLLMTAIGFFITAFSFLMDPYVAYFLPYDVSLLVVVNRAGIPVFSHHFSEIEIDEELFSGAVKAITTLMQETLKTEEGVQFVRIGNVKLVIELKEQISAFVITNRESGVLKEALASFLERFVAEYKQKTALKEGFVVAEEFRKADELVRQYLGFLRGSSRIQK